MMNFDFGIACTMASTIGSFIGTILIQKLILKTKRNSYLVIVLGAVLGVSTILIPIHTLMQLIEKIQEGKSIWSFNQPC
jgi:phosphotransferase system  glucose/maltose/N-acetylglucosamine-specific IIC component